MTALAHAFSLALLHFVWQGTAIAVLLWIVLFALRNRSAHPRYVLSCAALAAMVALPAITTCILYERPEPAAGVQMTTAAEGTATSQRVNAAGPLGSLQVWAVPVWCFGVLFFSARLAWGARQVSLLRRRGESADKALRERVARLAARMGLNRGLGVLVSPSADGPSVVGLMKPVILLPAATILGLTSEQLEAVLAHELAHIRRHDYLVNLFQMFAEALLFYHPAVWWISNMIRRERELCCDDEAVRACGDSFCYARALTALERIRLAAPGLVLGAADGPLAYRIKRLVGVAPEENPPSKITALLALGLALIGLGVSVSRLRAQAQPDAPGVRVDLGTSEVIHRAPVEYPPAARIKNVNGTVRVEVHLDENGNVSDARVLSGPEELRKPVLQSVLGWHFTPDAAGSTRVVNVQFDAPSQAKKNAPADPAPRFDDSNSRPDIEETTRFLKQELDQAKANLAQLQGQADNQDQISARQAEMIAREAELRDLQQKLATVEEVRQLEQQRLAKVEQALQAQERVGPIPQAFEGRTLRSIRVVGLGISREDFVAQAHLPIREGDTLTQSSMEAADRALKSFDEHLSVFWTTGLDSNDGIDLTIAAPGASIPGGRGGRGGGNGGGIGAGTPVQR
jgi:TonB family protein